MPHYPGDRELPIRGFEERVAPVEKAVGEAWWNLATTGTHEAQQELVRAGNEYNRLFSEQSRVRKGPGLVRRTRPVLSRARCSGARWRCSTAPTPATAGRKLRYWSA